MARVTLTQRVDELTVEVSSLKSDATANLLELKEGQRAINGRLDDLGLNGHKAALIKLAVAAPALEKLAVAAPVLIEGVLRHDRNDVFSEVLRERLGFLSRPLSWLKVLASATAGAVAWVAISHYSHLLWK